MNSISRLHNIKGWNANWPINNTPSLAVQYFSERSKVQASSLCSKFVSSLMRFERRNMELSTEVWKHFIRNKGITNSWRNRTQQPWRSQQELFWSPFLNQSIQKKVIIYLFHNFKRTKIPFLEFRINSSRESILFQMYHDHFSFLKILQSPWLISPFFV